MSDTVKINFHVPTELYAWLSAESERTGVPAAELSRRALQAFRYATTGEAAPKVETGARNIHGAKQPVLVATREV